MGHGVKGRVAFLAEANPSIGTGHVKEALALLECASSMGLSSLLVVPQDTPEALWAGSSSVPLRRIPGTDPKILQEIGQQLVEEGFTCALTTLRVISQSQIAALAEAGLQVVCLDECQDRSLSRCHTVPQGPDYLPLSGEYRQLRSQARVHQGPIRSLVVSMGGSDRTGATLRIVEALTHWDSAAARHIVLGAVFEKTQELHKRIRSLSGRWQIHQNPMSLAKLLWEADVGICAGGNTLLEMACVGTPALVLYEDPHERRQGSFFEKAGFGFCIGSGVSFETEVLRDALRRLEAPDLRSRHAQEGRRLVDGQGAQRICQMLKERT